MSAYRGVRSTFSAREWVEISWFPCQKPWTLSYGRGILGERVFSLLKHDQSFSKEKSQESISHKRSCTCTNRCHCSGITRFLMLLMTSGAFSQLREVCVSSTGAGGWHEESHMCCPWVLHLLSITSSLPVSPLETVCSPC